MNDTPFTTHGDEALEARIVSWVLGEASAFEAAELERLCEERPELMVFKRRMRALHGLLTEAEKQQPDEGWKLPEEKRRALDDIFGEPAVVRLESERERRVKHSGRRALLAIAACVVLTLVVLSLLPGHYEAAATIEIKPSAGGMSPLGGMMTETSGANRTTPQFFATEFEKIKSRNNLEKVVENLDLDSRWGVDKETALKRVKDSIETKNIRGTDLVEIRAREKDPDLAKEIAGEVTKGYKAYRTEIEKRQTEQQLAELNKAVRDQEDKVEERRKVLATIVRTKGITYNGQDRYAQAAVDEDTNGREEAIKKGLDAQDYADAKREFERDQELLQQMKLKKTGEEIALRIPRESVEVHDQPVVKASPNPVRAAAEKLGGLFGGKDTAVASSEPASRMVDSLPAPRAMIQDDRLAQNAQGERMRALQAGLPPAPEEAAPRPMEALDGAAAAPSDDSGLVASREVLEKTIAPAAEVMASNTIAGTLVPVPEVEVSASSLDFGDGSEFGGGWGGAVGGGLKSNLAAQESQGTGRGKAGTAYLSDANGKPEERHSKGASSDMAVAVDAKAKPQSDIQAGEKDASVGGNVPPLGGVPATGRLFKSDSAELNVPEIHTRWTPEDEKLEAAMAERKAGRYEEARKHLQEGLKVMPGSTELKKALEDLDDPIRTNPALTYEHQQNVDKVRHDLYAAEGKYNLGKYDESKRDYENVLRTDPSNQAARRGLEKLAAAKSDYYRAAYDHTRAELLAEVDEAWKLAVPAEKSEGEGAIASNMDRFYSYSGYRQNWYSETAAAGEASDLSLDPMVAEKQKSLNEQAAASKAFGRAGETEFSINGSYKTEYQFRGPAVVSQASDAQPALVDLMQEVSAAEEPFSTFSLNISDASFQVAQAALAKGERPDPAGVKVEQFYNAVDYGDPAPANGEPVAVAIGQVAHPVIPGRNLVRIALKTAAAGRSAAQPLRLTLLVDQSGSMSREDRRAAMEKALSGLGGLLTAKDRVSVIGFSRVPRLLADGITGEKANTLPQLINQSASEGGTNLEQAIQLASQLAERHKLAGAQNRIVLFTDGAANLGNADPEILAARVRELRQKGIAFDIAGIVADGLNDELLGELARHGNGRYHVVGKGAEDSDFAKQLAGAFRPAAENVKVQVRFNPERVARYKLIGFEKDRLKTEDFRNDAVDAAELAAEEAGVAIYQVEPIANGTGEIGEVSVRFRDTAAATMVERSWTIPHDADAPAIDRAPPSMQLATLAMLAAEKLKGGPLAEAIDFKQLATPAANVKQHYGNQGRPAEVLRMVDALK